MNSNTDLNKIDETHGNVAVEGSDLLLNERNIDRQSHPHHHSPSKQIEMNFSRLPITSILTINCDHFCKFFQMLKHKTTISVQQSSNSWLNSGSKLYTRKSWIGKDFKWSVERSVGNAGTCKNPALRHAFGFDGRWIGRKPFVQKASPELLTWRKIQFWVDATRFTDKLVPANKWTLGSVFKLSHYSILFPGLTWHAVHIMHHKVPYNKSSL